MLLAVVLAVIATGCIDQTGGGAGDVTVSGNGTILLIPVEGGLWGLHDDDGSKYYPLDLDSRFMTHGARVSYAAVLRPEKVTFQQWGIPVDILAMSLIPEESVNGTVVEGTGIVVQVNGNVSFFGIFASDGTLYRPPEIPSEYQVEGLGVNYTLRTSPDTFYDGPGVPVTVITLEAAEEAAGGTGMLRISGTVTYFPFEGGFYGIVADDGGEYLPLNLPPEFAKDGLAVIVTVEPAEGVSTIQQWGMPVRIVEMVVS
jgi:hypothetical protein